MSDSKKKLRWGSFTEDQAAMVIPHGCYCYDENGVCPFWDSMPSMGEHSHGYCHWIESGDWESDGTSLLWDQTKECGINGEA